MTRESITFGVITILLLWTLIALLANTPLFPPPWAVAAALVQDLGGSLGRHLLASTTRVLISMALAVVLGVPLGLGMGQDPRVLRLTAPLVYLTYPIPKIVFLPIVLLILGIGEASKIFLITLILFYQVLVVVRDAASAVRPELISSVRSLGARRRHIFRYVYLPASLPAIITSLRVSAGTAIAVLFFAESFATTTGLGYFIMVETWGRMAYTNMYAGVVAMSLLGLTIYIGLEVLETRLCGWLHAGR